MAANLHLSEVASMKTLGCFVFALAVTAIVAEPSFAQRQRGRGQFGGRQGGGIAFLIRNEAVQKELKMDKDQADKAAEAVKSVRDKHSDEFTKLRDLSQEERRAKMTELTKVINDETNAALETVLKPEQMKRLKELELQRAGLAALTRADVQKALALNDEQKGKIKTIAEESATKMRELMGGRGAGGRQGRGAGGGGRGMRPNQEKITAVQGNDGQGRRRLKRRSEEEMVGLDRRHVHVPGASSTQTRQLISTRWQMRDGRFMGARP